MASYSKTVRLVLTTALSLLIGLLVLQSLGYGIGFAIDPAAGVDEFGYETPTVVEDLTIELVGLVGVGMLGVATLLMLSAILIWREEAAGAYIAVISGGVYVMAGIRAFHAGWWWDAYFYSGTGALLIILSLAVRWLQSRMSGEAL